MKVLHKRSIQAALVAAVAAAIVIFFVWSSRGDAVTALPGPEQASKSAHAPASPPAAAAASTPSADDDDDDSLAAADPSKVDDYEDHPLAKEIHKVLASDQHLKTFMYYYNRPLLEEADQAKYHEFLADPAVASSMEHGLLYPEETKADRVGNLKRLMEIDYLREALEWKENPMREELITLVSNIILTDTYPVGMTMDMRMSLSGNKMELYELLAEVAPDRANGLVQASKGTRLERLVAYMATTVENHRRRDAKPGSEGSEIAPPRR